MEHFIVSARKYRPTTFKDVVGQSAITNTLENAIANYEYAKNRLRPGSPELSQSGLKVEQSRLQLENDQKNYERYEQLVKTGAVSRMEFDRVKVQFENTKRSLDIAEQSHEDLVANLKLNLDNAATQLAVEREKNGDYVLTSAINGQVISVFEQKGTLVRRGSPVAKIGGGAHLVKLYVAEEDINLLSKGQATYVALNTDPDQVYEARISKIYPAFDEQEQSFVAEARFSKKPAKLFTNTQLQANIIVAEKSNALTLPAEFILEGDSVLLSSNEKVAVELGIRNAEWVEITRGLSVDETVILPKSSDL